MSKPTTYTDEEWARMRSGGALPPRGDDMSNELDRFGIVPVNFRDPEENITVAGITLADARTLVAEIVRLTPEPRAPWRPCDTTWDCEGTWHFSECPKLPKRVHAGQPPVVFR